MLKEILSQYKGDVASLTSFGVESAVLLHVIAQNDPTIPIYFINTGKHFDETLQYRDILVNYLELENFKELTPQDGLDALQYRIDPDGCCFNRKVLPYQSVADRYSAWISGRKRYQSQTRRQINLVEQAGSVIKINPLYDWSEDRVNQYMFDHNLPLHPLSEQGYTSVGCEPCTALPVGNDHRSGRWSGQLKTECGLHI